MPKKNIGRNDPCPCGSGKKFKHCCLDKERSAAPSRDAADMSDALIKALEDQQFNSSEEPFFVTCHVSSLTAG